MSYFHAKLLEADLKMPSTADVADVIDRATKTWSPSKLKVRRIVMECKGAEVTSTLPDILDPEISI